MFFAHTNTAHQSTHSTAPLCATLVSCHPRLLQVIDGDERLQSTLAHEMCHVAAWLLKGVCKPPHGAAFKGYAAQVMRVYPHLNITTCHSYEIQFKYQYQCTTSWCGHVYGRHSKSIKVETQRCGRCMGVLQLMPQLKADGTPRKQRKPNKFALFVKVRHRAEVERA